MLENAAVENPMLRVMVTLFSLICGACMRHGAGGGEVGLHGHPDADELKGIDPSLHRPTAKACLEHLQYRPKAERASREIQEGWRLKLRRYHRGRRKPRSRRCGGSRSNNRRGKGGNSGCRRNLRHGGREEVRYAAGIL
ncbi:hypothetical protein B0H14DRAFT_2621729 [Mycena olivaceomarginata]|nr:hypothetical protein B0H14DRAFT_2621729 [Mycena olivaceomarginata]